MLKTKLKRFKDNINDKRLSYYDGQTLTDSLIKVLEAFEGTSYKKLMIDDKHIVLKADDEDLDLVKFYPVEGFELDENNMIQIDETNYDEILAAQECKYFFEYLYIEKMFEGENINTKERMDKFTKQFLKSNKDLAASTRGEVARSKSYIVTQKNYERLKNNSMINKNFLYDLLFKVIVQKEPELSLKLQIENERKRVEDEVVYQDYEKLYFNDELVYSVPYDIVTNKDVEISFIDFHDKMMKYLDEYPTLKKFMFEIRQKIITSNYINHEMIKQAYKEVMNEKTKKKTK